MNLPNRDEFSFLERGERVDYLIEYADQFETVPQRIAERPYPEERRVKRCESQAYVWAEDRDDGTLKYWFAVENPQGISAMSFCAILDETITGAPQSEVQLNPADGSTVPQWVTSNVTTRGNFLAKLSAASTLATLPVIIAGWVAQKRMIRGLAMGAIK